MDLVLLRADTPAMVPLVNPEAQIVFHAQRGEVDTVMVQGRVLKRGGRLIGVDFARARRLAEESRDHLRNQIGEQQWRDAQNPGPFQVQ